jgi:hypothetical protein
MIITRIQGGLGNQMFQYATGLSVARTKGVEMKLDLSWFDETHEGAPRPYQLDAFAVTAHRATALDFLHAGIPSQRRNLFASLLRSIVRFIDERLPFTKRKIILEPSTVFHPELFDVRDSCLLNGNWQSEKYFLAIADTVRKEFQLKNGLRNAAQAMAHTIREEKRGVPVSLHIRRGDSVSIAHSMQFHGSPAITYYRDAVALMREKVGNPVFYIFTDDVPWVTEHLLPELLPAVIVSSPDITDPEDITLMSHCHHHIVAHSSFSWWGAWLNPKEDKVVIGPKNWYKKNIDTTDLTPSSWIRIENTLD